MPMDYKYTTIKRRNFIMSKIIGVLAIILITVFAVGLVALLINWWKRSIKLILKMMGYDF